MNIIDKLFRRPSSPETLQKSGQSHLAGVVVSRFLNFIKNILFVNMLGTSIFGQLAMTMNLVTWLEPLMTLGIISGTQRFTPDYIQKKQFRSFIRESLGLMLGVISVLAVFIWLFSAPISRLVFSAEWDVRLTQLAVIGVATQAIYHFAYSIQRGRMRFLPGAVINVCYSFFYPLAAVTAALIVHSALFAVGGHIFASFMVGAAGIALLLQSDEAQNSIEQIKNRVQLWAKLIKYGGFLAVSDIAIKTYLLIIQILITRYLGTSEMGIFTAIFTISSIPLIAGTFFAEILFPRLTFDNAAGHFENVVTKHRLSLKLTALFLALVGAALAWQSELIVRLLFSKTVEPGAAFMIPLVVFCIYYGFYYIIQTAIKVKQRTGWLMVIVVLGTLLNFGLCTWSIPLYGTSGAVWSSMGTMFAIAAACLVLIHLLKLKVRIRVVILFLLPMIVLGPFWLYPIIPAVALVAALVPGAILTQDEYKLCTRFLHKLKEQYGKRSG